MIDLVLVYALPVLLGVTLHEAAHGFAAKLLGDPTAYDLGRVSINPFRHIDPVGTVVVPGLFLLASYLSSSSPFFFGWAKAVPISVLNLARPARDTALIAIAGPAANLAMGSAFFLLAFLSEPTPFAIAGVQVNAALFLLNLLPILPLDGGRIVYGLLPVRLSFLYSKTEILGFPILLALILSGALGDLLLPLVRAAARLASGTTL